MVRVKGKNKFSTVEKLFANEGKKSGDYVRLLLDQGYSVTISNLGPDTTHEDVALDALDDAITALEEKYGIDNFKTH